MASKTTYLPLLESHFRKLTSLGLDIYGPRHTAMWMAVIDTRTGRYPEQEHTPRRVYRQIGAPRGSTLYWDQPLVAAAHELSRITGNPQYARASDDYIDAFLAFCIDEQGMFQWGNHEYYDAFDDTVVRFHKGYHELRPITPAWELFWRRNPQATEKYIRAMARRHVYDPETGGFNRHDDGKREHAFLESGGILTESLAWLYGKTKDSDLLSAALRIAGYSYRHRGEHTGLIANEPDHGRWDSKVSTTEVGVWAESLLRAGDYTSHHDFTDMARDGIKAYLRHGYDEQAGMYYGQVSIQEGTPVIAAKEGYWPRKYADIWSVAQWPTHDYPMAVAEACLTLYQKTGDRVFLDGVHRWGKIICNNMPARGGQGTYAEHYGRCLHFLARAGRELGDARLLTQTHDLAAEAVAQLYENGMFQGYPASHLYESVDGIGFLALALISLETGAEMDSCGFGF